MELTVTCAIVLEQNEKMLLVQEATPAIYGKWNQPAGHLEVHTRNQKCRGPILAAVRTNGTRFASASLGS